jgi:signal transduction histidine kinase
MVAEGWHVRFDERLGPTRLPQTMEIALFRAAQEALSNVRKHAGPSRVSVSLQRTDDQVRLVIRDWGRGFRQRDHTAADTERGTHIGLEGMHERVGLLGGRCSVRSRVGRGTIIEVSVPVSDVAQTRADAAD